MALQGVSFLAVSALDHYSKYRDNIGVHYTSGIYNKAWCTLTNTSGWDYLRAFEVCVHVLLCTCPYIHVHLLYNKALVSLG